MDMKRTYVSPTMCEITINIGIIASSGVNSTDFGIGYGGVDTSGGQNPSVKEHNIWDDEW